ncbi:hypothetical protein ACSBR2_017451 [Camellia fascicularis]
MDRHTVDAIIVRAFCTNGIPFNVLRNPHFCQMVTAINNAPKGYKAPSFERQELLCQMNRGAMFLYIEDYFGVEKSGINIAELLLEIIDKVGPSNAIQVVTNNAVNCKLAGKEVEKIWTKLLIGSQIHIIRRGRGGWVGEIVKYFINHSHPLTIFRSHSKLELLKVAKARFASHFIMLKRLIDVKEALATVVVLNSCKELMKSGDEQTRDVSALITGYIGSDYFWDEVYNIVAITKPNYKLIRFYNKDSPLMGEIYEEMDNMLGEIKDVLKSNKYNDAYTQIEAIVLGTWEKMNVFMNSLGFALSPRFYDSTYVSTHAPGRTIRKKPNEDKEVVAGVLKAFEKIASHLEEA